MMQEKIIAITVSDVDCSLYSSMTDSMRILAFFWNTIHIVMFLYFFIEMIDYTSTTKTLSLSINHVNITGQV